MFEPMTASQESMMLVAFLFCVPLLITCGFFFFSLLKDTPMVLLTITGNMEIPKQPDPVGAGQILSDSRTPYMDPSSEEYLNLFRETKK